MEMDSRRPGPFRLQRGTGYLPWCDWEIGMRPVESILTDYGACKYDFTAHSETVPTGRDEANNFEIAENLHEHPNDVKVWNGLGISD